MEEYEVDLRDYFRVMWRKKWLILGIALAAIVLALLISFRAPSQYQANALYRLGTIPAASGTVINLPSTETTVALLSSKELLDKAWERLVPAGELPSAALKVTATGDNLIEIELKAALSPALLAQALAELVELFSAEVRGQLQGEIARELLRIQQRAARLGAEQARLRQQIDELLRREESAELKVGEFDATLEGWALRLELSNLFAQLTPIQKELGSLSLSQAELSDLLGTDWEPLGVISPPAASTAPIGPNWMMNLAVAGVLGLFVGVLVAFFVHYMQSGKRLEEASSPKG